MTTCPQSDDDRALRRLVDDAVADLRAVMGLVIRCGARSKAAAQRLRSMCRTMPYDGSVFYLRLDEMLSAVLDGPEGS